MASFLDARMHWASVAEILMNVQPVAGTDSVRYISGDFSLGPCDDDDEESGGCGDATIRSSEGDDATDKTAG